MLEIRHVGFVQQRLGGGGVVLHGGQFGIFGMHGSDMVVFGDNAKVAIAQLQTDSVVHRHVDGLAHALVGIGFHAVHLGQLVGPDHHGGAGHDLGLHKAQTVHDLDELAHGFVQHVHLTGFDRGQPCGAVCAQVDIFDPVHIGPAIDIGAPPAVVGIAHQNSFDAHFQFFDDEGAGAHILQLIGVVGTVHDCGRIVREVGDHGDIRGGEVQLDRHVIDNLDRAVARLAGGVVDQTADARRHRVAFDITLAPACDVARHVFGGEGVTVVPGHAGTDLERIFGRVVVGFPAIQQHAAEAAVAVVFHQIFQRATCHVGDFRPVGGAGVLEGSQAHLALDRAALRGGRLCLCRHVQPTQRIGRGGGHAKAGGAGQEFPAAELARLELFGIHQGGLVDGLAFEGRMFHLELPVTSLCFLKVDRSLPAGLRHCRSAPAPYAPHPCGHSAPD